MKKSLVTVSYALVLLAAPSVLLRAQQPAPSLPSLDSTMRPVSIDQAVQLAQENNPTAIVARGQIRSAESSVRSAFGELLPTLNVSMGAIHQSGDRFNNSFAIVPYTAPPWTYSTGLSSSLTLFNGGRMFADIAANRANEVAARANETVQDYGLALQVKTQYAAILAAEESERAARVQLNMADEQLKASIAKLQAGAATVADSLLSVSTVGQAQLALVTAQYGVQTASAALTRLAGTPYMITANPADSVDAPLAPIDTAALLELALGGPTVVQAEASLSSARAAERSAKTAYLPTITLNYNRAGNGYDQWYGLANGQLAYANTWTVGLNFPVFNQFIRENNVTVAAVNQDNAQALLRDARLAAQQNLITQLGALSSANVQILIAGQTITADLEALRVQEERYRLGASTVLDVLTAQSNLIRDQASQIQARQNFRVARAQVEAIIGRKLQ